MRVFSLGGQSMALAYQGEAAAARAAAEATLEGGAELGGRCAVIGHAVVGVAALAAGDGAAAHEAREAARQDMIVVSGGDGGIAARLECRGRAGRPGSRRRPPLGRRGRLDYNRRGG